MKLYELEFRTTGYFYNGKMNQMDKVEELTVRVDALDLDHAIEIMKKRYLCPTFTSAKMLFSFEPEAEFNYE